MNANGRRDHADKPLRGMVLCCTSVPPEQRTQYAEYAIQMGAEHKLDLTSDVTHLLVGDINTPKYQYVARERDDIKVVRPEWVEAVRECWMHDVKVDLNKLEKEYKLPALAGLKICITGFEDLVFRSQLQQNVTKNGGDYSGDLTKDVTHLIARNCEGKKFEYAVQWKKKIVGLKWLQDCLARGMQLDDTLYHPSKTSDEQGIGAWNKRLNMSTQTKIRPPPEQVAPEPARKLRRTASMKLGNQSEDIWGDIVGGAGFDAGNKVKEPLRSSKSMPAIGREKQVADSFVGIDHLETPPQQQIYPAKSSPGFFNEKQLCILGFEARRAEVLNKVILENGGTPYHRLEDMSHLEPGSPDHRLLIVPYSSSSSSLSQSLDLQSLPTVVTELWVEYCMHRKAFITPNQYPWGGLLQDSPVEGFGSISINASGFQGIETLHLSKMIRLMGGRYDEMFQPTTSVLVCGSWDPSSPKVLHAEEWGIPVVRKAWLWSCMKACQLRPFTDYLWSTAVKSKGKAKLLGQELHSAGVATKQQVGVQGDAMRELEQENKMPGKAILNAKRLQELLQKQKPGSDFYEEYLGAEVGNDPARSGRQAANVSAQRNQPIQKPLSRETPLTEISTNSPPKSRPISPQKKLPLFKTFDGNGSFPKSHEDEDGLSAATVELEPLISTEVRPNVHSINGAIQDLLKTKSRVKSNTSFEADVSSKKKLLGRTLSNISNSSGGSTFQASRSNSVDSMNIDSVGSANASGTSQAHGRIAASNRSSFTGRAKPRELIGAENSLIELGEIHHREYFASEELDMAPQQTQLGYEESEDAVLLREKLAQRRREQSRQGQVEGQLDREVQTAVPTNKLKRIMDDDALIGTGAGGWAAGRRTRQKIKAEWSE